MPRLLLPLSLIAIAAAVATLNVGRPRAAEPPAPAVDATKSAPFAPVGVSSCASAACHHGNGERGSVGSEYSTWIAVDPHAKAFDALYRPESVRMHKAMTGKDEGAHRNPLCLKCHGMGDRAPETFHADGVGCERCHGNAEKWKATHYQAGFDRGQGFVDLRKLPVRVEACMKCHVGDGTMEVDHDLIAAGHPRLRFEYGAYYANYPRHWAEVERGDKKNKDKDDEVRGWFLGQVVAARSAAELLAHRADHKPDSWPEFAEYDCAACHHALTREKEKGEKVPLGRMQWGTWYNALLPTLAGATNADREKLDASRRRLGELMQKVVPNKELVGKEAKVFAAELRVWEKQVAGRGYDPAGTRALMKALAGREDTVHSGWDGGTQVYLGLAALHHGLTDLERQRKKPTPFVAPLGRMRKGLVDAYPKNARPRYDVPSKYEPAPLVESLKTILKRLENPDAPND